MKAQINRLIASNYVVCATLSKVTDVFNIDQLFERGRGPQEGVFLLEALRRYPRIVGDSPRRETRYSHIIVRIPDSDYIRDDRIENGLRRCTLIRELQRRHHARYPVEGTTIRYRIEQNTELQHGEVQFLFGPAIYIPAEREVPLFRIQAAVDEQNQWQNLGAIYPNQRLTLLNGNSRSSSFPITAWPFSSEESLLLIFRPEPLAIVDVFAEPINSLAVTKDASGESQILNRRGRRLRLHIVPQELAAPRLVVSAPPRNESATIIPTRRWANLQITGIALQRLSVYANVGIVINDWRLTFNRAGKLVSDTDPEAVASLLINSADRISGEINGRSTPLSFPSVWRPLPELQLELCSVPLNMVDHYLGWIRLLAPLHLPVPLGREVSFGRGSEADIAPQLLADPRALRWNGSPARVGMSAEYLGLSRRHLRLLASSEGWQVRLESQSLSVYQLTPAGEFLTELLPGINPAAKAYAGERLVVGGYVLTLGATV